MRGTGFWIAAVVALFLGMPAHAQSEPLTPEQKQFCKTHPQECKEREARQKAWCKAHPQQCKDLKARREALRKRCASNKATCIRVQDGRNQRLEEVRKLCAADPAACEQKKAEARKYRSERRTRCQQNPGACASEREARRKRIEAREQKGAEPTTSTPSPAAEPAPTTP